MRTLSTSEIRAVLVARGFAPDGLAREHADSLSHGGYETVKIKRGNRFPLVIHPRHEGAWEALAALPGVLANAERMAHNSNFVGFDQRMHTGTRPIAFGFDFGFESIAALHAFIDRLLADQSSAVAVFDAEAVGFLDGFLADDNPQRVHWLPGYRDTLVEVRDALDRGQAEALFEKIWKSVDNRVANAGQGLLGFEVAEQARGLLVEVIREIADDGSPDRFEALEARLVDWKGKGHLPKVPRLMLARAFAAIHPNRYHTTVDAAKQERVIPWFQAHTGFVAPAGNWAARAEALTRHLARCDVFGGDRELRNMFPWYVFEQLRDASGRLPFRPGHVSRAASGQSMDCAKVRTIEYRQNVIQDRLVEMLRAQYGEHAVATEHPTGTGGRADALVQHPDGSRELYEIKPAAAARQAVREAIGQLLEYAWRRNGLEPKALHIVSDAPLDEVTAEYLDSLEQRFGVRFAYLHVPSGPVEVNA